MITGLGEAASARAVVLDMRGHPATGKPWDPYSFLQRIIPNDFSSPKYRVPVLAGNGLRDDVHPYEAMYSPLSAPAFAGPIVLITDHMAVSFAEDFSLMLVGAKRAKVVGRATAGTTGSVTGMQLPGNFQFYLTGMEARWPDGHVHFGEGIVPSVVVAPTVNDYANGKDPFITAAIEALAP
jgi:C-terminal processing protease CtpA/Prc